jgi:leucyl/phenylalanyl-tRNA---protein transferase
MQLSPDLLIAAYCQGVFPMAGDDGVVRFYEPDPRAIIPLDTFHVPRRLARTVRNGGFEIRADTSFRAVVEACAAPRPGGGAWINEEIIEAYTALHELGVAHSVEAWRGGELVGGLYGVAIAGLFAGESMFSRERDASKVALVHLVERLRSGGFVLLDTQFVVGPHMLQFGTLEIPRAEYHRRLAAALRVEARF